MASRAAQRRLIRRARYANSATHEELEQEEQDIDKDSGKMWRQAMNFSYLGIFFGVAIFIGYLGGAWLDRRLHTAPWLSIVGLLLGIASAVRELYLQSKRYLRNNRDS